MITLRDKAPQARRTADELDALLPSVLPEAQKPTGPSKKETQLAHDLTLLAARNRELAEDLKKVRGSASDQHEGNLATIAALRTENDAFRAELKTVKDEKTIGASAEVAAMKARVQELEEDLHEAERGAADLRKQAVEHVAATPSDATDHVQLTKLQEENIGLREGNQKLLGRLNKALAEVDAIKISATPAPDMIKQVADFTDENLKLRKLQEHQAEEIRQLTEGRERVYMMAAQAIHKAFKSIDHEFPVFIEWLKENQTTNRGFVEWFLQNEEIDAELRKAVASAFEGLENPILIPSTIKV